MSLCRLSACLALVAYALPTLGQAPAPPRFASEPYVIERSSTLLTMHADGTAEQTQTFVVRIQAESALRSFGIVALAYAKGSGTGQITLARVHHSDGSTDDTPLSGVMEQPAPVTREAPFYSDLVVLQLPVKDLRVGDTLEWQSQSNITHPEVPNQFYGQGDLLHTGVVILDQSYELHTPLSTRPTIWTNPRAKLTFAETTSGADRVDRWSSTALEPTVGPEAEARRAAEEKRVLTPEEALDAREGKLPDFAWTTFPDYAAVGAWYNSLARDRATPDSAIRARVAEITAGKSTDQARAEAVYTYVSTQIRYIGVAFGIGRYQPHTAAEVLNNQYGDCKDKHTLLAAMLAAINLPADPVLIGAGIRFNPAVPSPGAFNHLITHLTLNGHEVWLDSTAEGAPWDALQPVIRDEQALVIPATGLARVEHTPIGLPYPAFTSTTVTSTLDSNLNGESDFVFIVHDDDETSLRALLHTVSPSAYGTFVQNLMSNLGFGGTTSSPVIENLDNLAQPLTLRFHYHRTRDASWGDNRITATFGPIELPAFSPEKPPTVPIQLGEPRTLDSTVAVTLPEGWHAQLPEATHAHTAFATADVTYRLDHGKLIEQRKVVILQRELPVADFKQYQSWYDTAGIGSYPYLQLAPPVKVSSNSGHTAPAPPSTKEASQPAAPSNPEAAQLVQEAFSKLSAADTDGARAALDKARALNPTERRLWLGYAAIAMAYGAPAEAADDIQHELKLYPNTPDAYRALVALEMSRHGMAEAVAAARKWTEVAPEDPIAATVLVQVLTEDLQYSEAATAAQQAVKRIRAAGVDETTLTPLLLAEASAYSKAGDRNQAATIAAPLLITTHDPGVINNVAYFLADAQSNLPVAEAALRSALQTLDEQTSGWTAQETAATTFRTESSLAAAWDTLGWILFQEGKPEQALPWIRAAAAMSDHQDVRNHLSQLGKALHQPGLNPQLPQALRTISLGPAHDLHGTADLRFLLADGQLAGVDSTGKSTLPDAPALLKSASLQSLLPPGSKAHLVRSGIINCVNGTCELILVPLSPNGD